MEQIGKKKSAAPSAPTPEAAKANPYPKGYASTIQEALYHAGVWFAIPIFES